MKKIFFVLLFLIFPSVVFAATPVDGVVYTWGYGDLIEKTLLGIVNVVGNGEFVYIFRLFLSFAILSSAIGIIFSIGKRVDYFQTVKIWILGSLIFTLLFNIKITIEIEDVTTGYSAIVTNVPWVIGKPLAFFSTIEKSAGEIVESAFIPVGVSYSDTGPMVPLSVLAGEVQETVPVDPYLYKSVNNYIKDCVIPDIIDGVKDLTLLQTSTTLWDDLGGTNPGRFTVLYDSTSTNGTVDDCESAYTILTGRLGAYAGTDGIDVLAKSLGFASSAKMATILGTSNDFFLGYTDAAQNAILQGIAINQMRSGYKEWAIAAGVNPDSLSYTLSTANEQLKQTSLAKAITGAKFLPMAKGVGVAFFVAMLPFMIVISLIGGNRIFQTVFTIYVWFLLWHVGETVLNAFLLSSAKDYFNLLGTNGPNLLNSLKIASVAQEKLIAFSSFYWLIPTISFGLAAGGAYALTSVASGLMGAVGGAAASGAAEAAKGSANFGNLAFNNVSSNNVDWLHRTNMGMENRLDVGAFSTNGAVRTNLAGSSSVVAGGKKESSLAGRSTSDFGLGSVARGKFISGNVVINNEGLNVNGVTSDGYTVSGLVDNNGSFTGTVNTGKGYKTYDHGELIKSEEVIDGFKVMKIGDTNMYSKDGASVTVTGDGTVTGVNLSNTAIDSLTNYHEGASKEATALEKEAKEKAKNYVKNVGIDESYSTVLKAARSVESSTNSQDEVKKTAQATVESAATQTLEDLYKAGVIKREDLQAKGKGSLGVKVNILKLIGAGFASPVEINAGAEGSTIKIRSRDGKYEWSLTGKKADAFKRAFTENFMTSQGASKVLKEAQRGVKEKGWQKRFQEAQNWSDSISSTMQKAKEFRKREVVSSGKSLTGKFNALPEVLNSYLDSQGITNPNERMWKAAKIGSNLNILFATNPQKGLQYLNQLSNGKLDALEKIEKMKVNPKPLGINVGEVPKKTNVNSVINNGQQSIKRAYKNNPGHDAGAGYNVMQAYLDYLKKTGGFGHVTDPQQIEEMRNLIKDSYERRGLFTDKDSMEVVAWNNDPRKIFPTRKVFGYELINETMEKLHKEPSTVVDKVDKKYMEKMKAGDVVATKDGLRIAKVTAGLYVTYSKDRGYSVIKNKSETDLPRWWRNPDGTRSDRMTEEEWKKLNYTDGKIPENPNVEFDPKKVKDFGS